MYAVVDLETTGGSLSRDRITEVAIYLTDGQQVEDAYTTLVNPEVHIPLGITQMTGISDQMVADAPKFYEVARNIVELTQGRVFVAHNVSFDYNFLRAEFKRLGYSFQRKCLCTVRLSRKVFPGHKSYSLGQLCNDRGITIAARHRAGGDAEAAVELLHQILATEEGQAAAHDAQKRGSHEGKLPPNLPREAFEQLPDSTGVYYFFDERGRVIYVGKANQIRQRVLSHFTPAPSARKALKMKNMIADVSYEVTGTDLIALLQESHEIKRLKPLFNQQQKRTQYNYGLFDFEDANGYKWLTIGKLQNVAATPHTSFTSGRTARNYLEAVHKKYGLCEQDSSLHGSKSGCFRYQIGHCSGVCMGLISPEAYNARVDRFLQKLNVRGQSFAIIGTGRTPEERSIVWVEDGVYHGYGYFDADTPIEDPFELKGFVEPRSDNLDVQRILNHYLRQNTGQQHGQTGLKPLAEQAGVQVFRAD